MRITLGADHAGLELKRELLRHLQALEHEVLDVGDEDIGEGAAPSDSDAIDYPDVAEAVGRAVTSGRAERGILLCGSGIGASVAANKLPGIRAGLCHDVYSARQAVEHVGINVLVLGARVIDPALAQEVVRAFLSASFSGAERHRRRIGKIVDLERR